VRHSQRLNDIKDDLMSRLLARKRASFFFRIEAKIPSGSHNSAPIEASIEGALHYFPIVDGHESNPLLNDAKADVSNGNDDDEDGDDEKKRKSAADDDDDALEKEEIKPFQYVYWNGRLIPLAQVGILPFMKFGRFMKDARKRVVGILFVTDSLKPSRYGGYLILYLCPILALVHVCCV
jgi:hypothetical protein